MHVAGMQASFTTPSGDAGERILEAFYGLQASSFGGVVIYDLVITDRRIVGIIRETVSGSGVSAVVIGTYALKEAKARHTEYRPADLDRWVAQHPKSFSFPNASVKEAAIKGVLEKAVQIRSGKRRFYIYVPKADLPRLEAALAKTVPHATG